MMLVSTGLWALHDALGKTLAGTYGVFEILFLRSTVALALVTVFLLAAGGSKGFRTERLGLNVVRGILGCISFGLFLAALPMQPLVNSFAIMAGAPVIITVLSVPLLREPVGLRRWLAVLGGFVAILFMLQPGGGMVPLAVALIIASNVFYGFGVIIWRVVSRTDTAGAMTFYTLLTFVAVTAAALPFDWITPGAADWWAFLAVGVVAAAGLYTMTLAFSVAAPSLVAPFEYSGIPWAAMVGWIMWGEVPTWIVIGGSAGLIICGLYMLNRERVAARRTRPVAAHVFGHDGSAGGVP